MRALLTAYSAIILLSCNQGPAEPSSGEDTAAVTSQAGDQAAAWLIGTWVIAGESCESDGGIVFQPDGTYATYGEDGRWALEGDRLSLTPTMRFEMGDTDSEETIENAAPIIQHIVSHEAGRYTARFDDGVSIDLERCPDPDA